MMKYELLVFIDGFFQPTGIFVNALSSEYAEKMLKPKIRELNQLCIISISKSHELPITRIPSE